MREMDMLKNEMDMLKKRMARGQLLPMAMLILGAACSTQPTAAQLPKLNAPLQVAQGEQLTISLDANPSTGFAWQLATPLDEKVVTLVSHANQPPDNSSIGASGTDVWTFKAVGPGSTAITLEYRRPWEKDVPAAERKTYSLLVR